jgi:hypothetical protein
VLLGGRLVLWGLTRLGVLSVLGAGGIFGGAEMGRLGR